MEDQTRSLKDPWELDGVSTFDPEALLAAIMIKGGQMEPLFADPRFFYNMNNMWWKKWIPTFKYWWTVSEKEYEPLWDREGFEEITDHTEESGTLNSATTGIEVIDTDTTGREVIDTDTTDREVIDTDTTGIEVTDEDTTSSLTGKEIVDDNTTSSSNTSSTTNTDNRVSAYDSSTYQPSSSSSSSSWVNESASSTEDKITDTTTHTTGVLDKTVNTTGTADTTRNTTGAIDTTRNTTGAIDTTRNTTGAIDTDTTGSKDSAHSLHTWGNWGISTTSQKLLYSEYEVRFKLNPYELMSDIFLNEMAVRVF